MAKWNPKKLLTDILYEKLSRALDAIEADFGKVMETFAITDKTIKQLTFQAEQTKQKWNIPIFKTPTIAGHNKLWQTHSKFMSQLIEIKNLKVHIYISYKQYS